jgi:dihydropteroate synthase
MPLFEPQGLLTGQAAARAVAAGCALPLAGGPVAFAFARLLEDDRVIGVSDLPAAYDHARDALTRPPRVWARFDGKRPLVMGIINVTPDSFSDGGQFETTDAAIAAGLAIKAAGGDIVDVGGESTRPNSAPTPPAAERARVIPVVRALAAAGAVVSIDTRNAATMAEAIKAGATIVNDVSGLAHDPDAASVVAESGCAVIVMHMRGTPATMMGLASYGDVAVDVARELALRVESAETAGIARSQIAIDPGIGFAKTGADNVALLSRLGVLLNLGLPLVVGASRKAFIGRLGGADIAIQRDPGSLAAALFAALNGAAVLRVHDVPATVQAIRVWRSIIESG